jgi:hypothetical protein
VAHEVDVVAVRVVLAEVPAARLVARLGRHHEALGEVEQEAQLDGLEQLGVVALAAVGDADAQVAVLQRGDVDLGLLERGLGAVDGRVGVHRLLQRRRIGATDSVPPPSRSSCSSASTSCVGLSGRSTKSARFA